MAKLKQRRDQGQGSVFLIGKCRRWYIQYYVDGVRKREPTGLTSRQQAQDLLTQRLASTAKGEPLPQTRQYRVSQLYHSMLDHYKALGKPMDVARRWKHLQPHFADTLAQRLTTDQCVQYRLMRTEQKAKPATVNRELGLLKRMLRLAQQATPPKLATVPHIPLVKEDNARQGFVEAAQYAQLVAAAQGGPLWMRVVLELAWTYGWRKSELLGLRCSQVDLLARTIRLEAGTTKNKEGRQVSMTQAVQVLLQAACHGKKPEQYVLTRDNGCRVRNLRKAWAVLCCKAGVGQLLCKLCDAPMDAGACPKCKGKHYRYRGLILHDMRRSAAKALRAAGVPESVVMAMGGWKTAAMFRRYAIVSAADHVQAVQKLEAARAQQTVDAKVTQTEAEKRLARMPAVNAKPA